MITTIRKFFGMAPYNRSKPTVADISEYNDIEFTAIPDTADFDVRQYEDGWYVTWADGLPHKGPYKRPGDAKGVRTRLTAAYSG